MLVVVLGFSLLVGFGVLLAILNVIVSHRLRTRHPETFEQLGQPSLLTNNGVSQQSRIWKFVWRSEFKALDDPKLSTTCRILKWVFVVYVILFLFLVLLIITGGHI